MIKSPQFWYTHIIMLLIYNAYTYKNINVSNNANKHIHKQICMHVKRKRTFQRMRTPMMWHWPATKNNSVDKEVLMT